ncbi:MAG: BMP family ABC transporter substrate-binding protein [Chloroflexaceae bacterium]|nr:BMP family ABC transporter substrate-binding protein [Chloroflexaceae bacterium]
MRTVRSLFLLLAILLPLLAACGGTQPTAPVEEPPEAPAAETEPTEAPAAETEPTEAPAAETEPAAAGDFKLGLVTDIGRVNDGTFNQFAHEGALQAAEEFGLEYRFIETQAQADYEQNIQTLLEEDFNILVTVGFLIADATYTAAQENPDVIFIGIDQSFTGNRALPNLVGIQFREDQGGFLAGALAGMMTQTDIVGVVGGIDIPPVKRFRNGFDNGVVYINPDATSLGVYIPSFTDPAQGASAAEQFIGEGADIIMGAGGPTGSGAIAAAAEQGVFVMGVDQDEYLTTFGGGTTPGADRILTSAIKRVDVGVYDEVQAVVEGTFEGGGDYVLDVANGGIGYASYNETEDEVPENVKARMEQIEALLASGELTTGVDPATGDPDAATVPEPNPFDPNEEPVEVPEAAMAEEAAMEEPTEEAMAEEEPTEAATTDAAMEASDLRVGLVTDIGRVNDGTFNQFAHEGALQASEEFGLEYRFIETQAQADYEQNIQTLVDENFNVIVSVGFLIADATYAAAQENPDITFIGVDQDFTGERALPNLIGIQFREDQAGFLVGALAGMITASNIVGVVGGIDIPPVKRFRNGFDNGVAYINPDATSLGVYIPSFTDPAQGASAAEQFIGEGADVIFGAGGPTGSGAIAAAAEQGVFVIGVDQDEYFTTFGGGTAPGADRIVSSAIKRVDVGVYDQIRSVLEGTFEGEGNYILNAENGGIGYADFHETADLIPAAVQERLEEIVELLASEELTTGVDPVSGDVDEATIPEPEPFEG